MTVYALPATVSLPRGSRPDLEELTIEDAALRLRHSGAEELALIEEARVLVGERIAYCRRNSFDSYRRAFRRGYGYCQQEAFALAALLGELGFTSWPVHCEHCDFPDKANTGHAWVQVQYRDEVMDIDSKYMDAVCGEFSFQTNSPVRKYTPLFRLLSGWGSAAVNAHRYYKTRSDVSAMYQRKNVQENNTEK
jgi:hypothetical protein